MISWVKKGKMLVYKLPVFSLKSIEEAKNNLSGIDTLDISKVSVSDHLFPVLYDLDLNLILSPKVEKRFQRLRLSGYFERLKDSKKYYQTIFETAKLTHNNWLIYDDLRKNQKKEIIEILDYGDPMRYRKLKSYLTQPITLFNHIENKGFKDIWIIGEWDHSVLNDPKHGLYLPGDEPEYTIFELLKGIMNGEYKFE